LELRQQVEQEQHSSEGRLGGMKLFETEMVRSQVVSEFSDAILHVGTPVVVLPDLVRSVIPVGHEDAERVAGHVDQLAAHAGPALPHAFANDYEPPLGGPAVELQPGLAHCIVGVQLHPFLNPLGLAFDPLGHARDYNVG